MKQHTSEIFRAVRRPVSGYFLALASILLLAAIPSAAADHYYSQAGGGSGTSCSSTHSAAQFNSNADNLQPGDTAHLCGTFTFADQTAGLVVRASGTSGNPITIQFENGAILQSTSFLNGGGTSGSGLNLVNVSYVTVNGGGSGNAVYAGQTTTCGLTNPGIIQDTNNGTGLETNTSEGIEASGSTGVVIENLLIQNMYVRTSLTDTAADAYNTVSIHANPATNMTVTNSCLMHAGLHIGLNGNGTTINGNFIYDMNHGYAGGAVNNTSFSGYVFSNNHISYMAGWDDATGNDSYHHDGIHIFPNSGSTGRIQNLLIYNNVFDGDGGINSGSRAGPQAWIYLEGQGTGGGENGVFNNVFLNPDPSTTWPNEWDLSSGQGWLVANNTMFGPATTVGQACWYGSDAGTPSGDNTTFNLIENNICGGQAFDAAFDAGCGGSISPNCFQGPVDYNLYQDDSGLNYANVGAKGWGQNTDSLSAWQELSFPGLSNYTACSVTANHDNCSLLVTEASMLLSATGVPQSGSPAIGAGNNLSRQCQMNGGSYPNALCSDINGNARPSSGAWAIGAFNSGSAASQTPPSPPTGLTAIVN